MSCADKEAESCKDEVAELNRALAELGPLIKAAQVVIGDAASAQAKQYRVDGDKLGAAPCALDIVLLPFDEDKGSPEDWQHYDGARAWSLHPRALGDGLRKIPMPACLGPHLLLANAFPVQGRFASSTTKQALPNGEGSAVYAYMSQLAALLLLSRASHNGALCCRRPE